MRPTSDVIDAKLLEMVSAIDAAVMIVDASGVIEIANAKAAALLGLHRDAIESRPIGKLFSGPSVRGLAAKIRDAIRHAGEPWSETFSMPTPDGRDLQIVVRFSVVQPSADHISVLGLLAPGEQAARTAGEPQQSTVDEVRSMISSRSGKFTAGHLEMIGLGNVRDSLGDRWEKLASRVYDKADAILRSRLANEDVFRRDADGNYVICFAHLCGEQAWFKAKALGQEICEALIGTEADDTLAEFKLDAETRQRISDVKTGTYEIEFDDAELAEIPDIMDVVKSKVGNAAAMLRKRAVALINEMTESGGVQLIRAKTLANAQLPLQVASFDPVSLMNSERLRNVYCDSPKLLAQLDALLLGNTLERLYSAAPAKVPATLVEVHFSTLADRGTARAYFGIAGSADGGPAQSLVLKVRDIPVDLHRGRISEVLRMVRSYSRATAIRLRQPTLGNIDLSEARVSVVTFGFDDLKAMFRKDETATLRFVRRLRQYSVRIGVSGVAGAGGMDALTAIKPDFVSVGPLPMSSAHG